MEVIRFGGTEVRSQAFMAFMIAVAVAMILATIATSLDAADHDPDDRPFCDCEASDRNVPPETGRDIDVDFFVGYGDTVFWTSGNGGSTEAVASDALGRHGFGYCPDGKVVPHERGLAPTSEAVEVFLWSSDGRWAEAGGSLEDLALESGDRIALVWDLSAGGQHATPDNLTMDGFRFEGLYYEDTGEEYSFSDGPVYSGLTASWTASPASADDDGMWAAAAVAVAVVAAIMLFVGRSAVTSDGSRFKRTSASAPGFGLRAQSSDVDAFSVDSAPDRLPGCDPLSTRRFPETLHCAKCDHLWMPKKGMHPKCCPKCHSRRWDEAPYIERECPSCHSTWTGREERCPICRTATWVEREVYGHICNQCASAWYSYSASPVRCPRCQSTKWDDVVADDRACLRCGHTWKSRGTQSKKCPSCGSYKWNEEPKQNTCTRCSRVWIQSGDRPKCCPFCRSKKWDEPVRTHVCPSCGFSRNLRSNSRPVCPVCGANHGKYEF